MGIMGDTAPVSGGIITEGGSNLGGAMAPPRRRGGAGGGFSGMSPLGGGMGGGMGAGMGQFTADNNLINSQITPQNSALTQWGQNNAVNAGNTYANFQFSPFQSVNQPDFAQSRGMLNGANTSVQGLNYDWSNANQQYGNAASAGQAYGGLQALGTGAFSGGGANMADFGAANGLIDKATGAVGSPFDYAGDTAKARSYINPALDAAMTGPDRNALAAESLSLLEQRSQPGFEQALRGATQKAAAMGRRGAGMTTNELGDITTNRERDLSLARRDLANQASSQTMQDKINRANLALGVTQGLGAEDRGAASTRLGQASALQGLAGLQSSNAQFNAGQAENAAQRAASGAQFGANFQRGLIGDRTNLGLQLGDRYGQQTKDNVGLGMDKAGFQRGIGNDLASFDQNQFTNASSERNAGRADEFNRGNFARNQFGDFSNFLSNQQGNDRSNRNELRGERDYQYGLSQDAINNAYRQQGWEETLRNNRYNRAMGTSNFGFGANGQLTDAYGNAANTANNNAADAYGASAELMRQIGSWRRQSPTTNG